MERRGTNESWLVGTTAHGYQVRVAVPKDYVWSGTLASSALILGLSTLFIIILYMTLRRTFSDYQSQVVDLVDSIQAITKGEKTKRINTDKKGSRIAFDR